MFAEPIYGLHLKVPSSEASQMNLFQCNLYLCAVFKTPCLLLQQTLDSALSVAELQGSMRQKKLFIRVFEMARNVAV